MPVADTSEVVVTGIGLVTPLGIGREAAWDGLLQGATCGRLLDASLIDHFDDLTQLLKRPPGGAPVDHLAVMHHLRKQLPAEQRASFAQTWGQDCLNGMLASCLLEAVQDAGLGMNELSGPQTGCVIGTSKPSLRALERSFRDQTSAPTGLEHLWQSGFMPDSPLRMVQTLTGAMGPFGCPVAACATGLFSFLEAFTLVASGQCDVCVAGSGDASLRASVLSGFHRLGVTSKRTDPACAGRPFDQQRDGFVIGEGAGMLLLESARHAAARGANPYARVHSGGVLTDCTGMTQVDTSGEMVARVIEGLGDIQPDFVSLHGTATPTNDLAEARGLASLQGRLGSRLPAFSIKGAIGHTLGAAASIELAVTCLALRHGVMPGTANHVQTDADCDVDVAADSRRLTASQALKLSLGFGGHVAGCVLTSV
ncbi:MAG: beta-ketoacyl-[acyl-carrier-protein] synthase family protein [Planctomycetaceae bacterium]|nr:beta-ketoacyl-[acyl-carrier-protein] synthase family protein [Planctomycetaceae bacterium]